MSENTLKIRERLELNKDRYLLDGWPISSIGIIKEACYYSKLFEEKTIRFVDEAKEILQEQGMIVKDNLDQPD